MLHAPDFLGYEGAIDMARDHADVVKRGLALKKAGNDADDAPRRARDPSDQRPRRRLLPGAAQARPRRRSPKQLKRARDIALATVRWAAGFDFPDCDARLRVRRRCATRTSIRFNEGRIVSNRGLDIAARDYDDHFEETHVAHSTALHSRMREARGTYLVGPLARYALNFDRLSPLAREAAHDGRPRARSAPIPFRASSSAPSRCSTPATRRSASSTPTSSPDRPSVPVEPRAGTGYAATEAPRGMLYHRYRLAADGTILDAQIVPPTSQNQASIEEDLTILINGWLDLPDDALRHRCEQTVRNYDPCISCATHFLDLRIDRG